MRDRLQNWPDTTGGKIALTVKTVFWDLEGRGGSFHSQLIQRGKIANLLSREYGVLKKEAWTESPGASDSLPIMLCYVDKE